MGNEVPDTVLIRECDVDVLTNQLFPDVDPARPSDARRRLPCFPADDQINSSSFVGGWEAGVSGCDQRLDRLTHVGVTPRPRVIVIRLRLFDLTTWAVLCIIARVNDSQVPRLPLGWKGPGPRGPAF